MSETSTAAETETSTVSYRLLDRITDLLICSRCFRRNVRRPIRTVLTDHSRPVAVCPDCSGSAKSHGKASVVSLRSGR